MFALSNTYRQALQQHNLPATPAVSASGVLLTAHATIHTKGSWATILTTVYDVYGFWLCLTETSAASTRTDMLLDLAIGAGQENIIIPNWLCGWRTTLGGANSGAPPYVYFPIFIPRGTLVSARIQALLTLDTARLVMATNEGTSGFMGPMFSGCDAYGIDTTLSAGTSHTPGNTGVESTPADIGGTLSRSYGAVLLGLGGSVGTNAMTQLAYHWELVVGAVSRYEWLSITTSNERHSGPHPPTPCFFSFPVGTQLQIQAESEGTAQALDIAFYCFY